MCIRDSPYNEDDPEDQPGTDPNKSDTDGDGSPDGRELVLETNPTVSDQADIEGYVNNFEAAKKKGITKIICVSVNDPNVMKAWGDSQKVEDKIFMAADPYCEFTKSIGADIDRFDRGQGTRSARYTMLVENNIATKIKAEEDTATCEMSAAENFLVSI